MRDKPVKKFFNKDFWQLPEFMYDRHLRVLAWMLALCSGHLCDPGL